MCAAETSSALLIACGTASGGFAPLIASRSDCSDGALASTGCRLEQSMSGLAAGSTGPRFVMYGVGLCEVVGASPSLAKWRSSKTARAVAASPSAVVIAFRPQKFVSSPPPPLPKMPPTSDAIATASSIFHGAGVCCRAGYSAGIFEASISASLMYWFTPSVYACRSM